MHFLPSRCSVETSPTTESTGRTSPVRAGFEPLRRSLLSRRGLFDDDGLHWWIGESITLKPDQLLHLVALTELQYAKTLNEN